MKTKLEAARIAVNCGGIAIIASGRTPGILDKIFSGEEVGTVFLPAKTLPSKKRWIAYAALVAGTLKINEGAVKALIENKASLLFAGVTAIEGDFERQDVVSICGPDGTEIARGIVNYSRRSRKTHRASLRQNSNLSKKQKLRCAYYSRQHSTKRASTT